MLVNPYGRGRASGAFEALKRVGADYAGVTSQLAAITQHLKSARFFKTAIDTGHSMVVLGIGDSTMTTASNWLGQAFKKLGSKYGYNVKHAQFNYDRLDYDAWEDLAHTGDDAHIAFVKDKTVRKLSPDEIQITSGDLDVTMRISMDDWDAGVYRYIISRGKTVGKKGWGIAVSDSNKFVLFVYPDGTNSVGVTFTDVSTASNVDGQPYWYRVTMDVDDGGGHYAARVLTSTDGSTWTVAQTVTGATTTAILNDLTESYSLGGSGDTVGFTGKFYECRIRDGINGKIANPQPITAWQQAATDSFSGGVIGGTPTIYIYNSAIGGYRESSYMQDAYFVKAIPNLMCPIVLYSLGYNDVYVSGKPYITSVDALISRISAATYGAVWCLTAQAPTIAPSEHRIAHVDRIHALMSYANLNGFDIISFYEAFVNSGMEISDLVNADGTHPNTTNGQPLLRDVIAAYFDI